MQKEKALILEIFRQDSGLKMGLFEADDFVSTLRHYANVHVLFTEIDSLCSELAVALNKVDRNGNLDPDALKQLTKVGSLLWSHLFSRQIKEKLKNSGIFDLVLSIDEELVNIPWELLYDGTNFLCLNFNLGRVVRTKSENSPVQYRSFSSAPKMLILANPTNDLKSAYIEGLNIKNQFERKRNNVRIDFKSTLINRLYVKKNLQDYDIMHFAGHCEYEESNPSASGWVLSDGRFTVQDILGIGPDVQLPSLIFSNACHSAFPGASLPEADYQKKAYSLAAAFLLSGVRHYIGTIRRIEDTASLSFAQEFYSHLVFGKPIGESLRLARIKLIKDRGIMSIHWASHLLYGNPGFVFFKSQAKAEPKRPKITFRLPKKVIGAVSAGFLLIFLGVFLYFWLPSKNPNNYFLLAQSKKMFSVGDNKGVIALGNKITSKDPDFLAAYPVLAEAYQRSGDRENALKYYFEYARFSEKKNDKRHLAASFTEIGWNYHLQGEYAKAFEYYDKAINLSRQNKDKLNEARALRKLAVWYIDKKNDDKALELLTKSSEINRSRQHAYEHKYNLACDYFDMGLVFINKNDYESAKEFYDKSRRLFEKLKLKNELNDYYFNLGEIYVAQKQFQKALDSYMQGLKIDERQNNKVGLACDYNMIGELYVEMDNWSEAEKYFMRSSNMSKEINARPELAGAYYNLGLLYKKMGKKNKVREYWRQAQEIYKAIDESMYQEIKKELLALNNPVY
ncbi:MAG: tetratricopeptide repeat protein [Candidatus Omnitrophica bacterium]|nr:tetratricopeptide repeat protein [Candidatus Omnitrophota bacterium]